MDLQLDVGALPRRIFPLHVLLRPVSSNAAQAAPRPLSEFPPELVAPNCPVITLDGLAGCGKSTLARHLARELHWAYLDSGAWYRALTWAVLDRRKAESAEIGMVSSGAESESGPDGKPPAEAEVLGTLFQSEWSCDENGTVFLDGRPLQNELRTPAIDQAVADVADMSQVRKDLTKRMRDIRQLPGVQGVVADGRDAGTIIFADADLKVFVHADLEARAERRFRQNQARGLDANLDQVIAHLRQRDGRDADRGEAAPKPTEGGYVLDNTHLTVEEAIGRLLTWAKEIHAGPTS